jgi:endonuclease/exonuclease/phosphatase family metal-dependent hydrolase
MVRAEVEIPISTASSPASLYIYNLHLDHISEESRIQQLKSALEIINTDAKGRPHILCGPLPTRRAA